VLYTACVAMHRTMAPAALCCSRATAADATTRYTQETCVVGEWRNLGRCMQIHVSGCNPINHRLTTVSGCNPIAHRFTSVSSCNPTTYWEAKAVHGRPPMPLSHK
jgi:hypothetical protein